MTFPAGHGEICRPTWVIHMATRRPSHNTPIHMHFLSGSLQKRTPSPCGSAWCELVCGSPCGSPMWGGKSSGGLGGPPPKLKVRKGNPTLGNASGPGTLSGPVPWRKLIWINFGKSGVMFAARRLVFRTGRMEPPSLKRGFGNPPSHKHKA